MSDAETKPRAQLVRSYVPDATKPFEIERRVKGAATQVSFADAKDDVLDRWAVEGMIYALNHGASVAAIVSGAALSDRSPPAEKAAKEREPGAWVQAIAAVKAEQMIKAKQAGGEKPGKDEKKRIGLEAQAWAKGLAKDQIAKLRKNVEVQIAHARITGVKESLDDMLTRPVDAEMQEAAE